MGPHPLDQDFRLARPDRQNACQELILPSVQVHPAYDDALQPKKKKLPRVYSTSRYRTRSLDIVPVPPNAEQHVHYRTVSSIADHDPLWDNPKTHPKSGIETQLQTLPLQDIMQSIVNSILHFQPLGPIQAI